MRFFDLHCDTISTCLTQGKGLFENDLQLDLKRGLAFDLWVQTFAFWIEDSYRGEAAWEHFCAQYAFFQSEYAKNAERITLFQPGAAPEKGLCHAILAVEGGAVLAGKIERVKELSERGIAILTLTWNGDNELGCGVFGSGGGLTDFGKQAVLALEREKILPDVSHLNEQGFYDLCRMTEGPILATHSNGKTICPHPRNLTDEQLAEIIRRGGLVGLNFYPVFVNGEQDCSIDEILRHAEHILSLGGEQVLSIGSDFDGATMPAALPEIKKVEKCYISMVKYFGKEIADRIFYENAMCFFKENLPGRKFRFPGKR